MEKHKKSVAEIRSNLFEIAAIMQLIECAPEEARESVGLAAKLCRKIVEEKIDLLDELYVSL